MSHLSCNVIPLSSIQRNGSSPIAGEINQTEQYQNVGAGHLPSDKSSYAFDHSQANIKIEQGYPINYNIPPMVFVPSTNSPTACPSEIGTTNINSATGTPTSSSPIQIQNVGTIWSSQTQILHSI